jgi:hypothetical protein
MRREIDLRPRRRPQFTSAEAELLRAALASTWPEE